MKLYSSVEKQTVTASNFFSLDTDTFSIEVQPADKQQYRAHAETAALGAMRLALIQHPNSAIVSRKHEAFLEPGHKRCSLVHVVEGEIVISHHVGTSTLKAGEYTLMDNSHARKMLVYDHVTLFVVSIPCQMLLRYLPLPAAVEGQTMQAIAADDIDHESVFAPLLQLWDQIRQGNLRDFAPMMSDKFLSRVSRHYHGRFPALGSAAVRRVAEVKHLIETRLSNPDLSVEAIAESMGVSSRYLRGLFRGGEKLSRYILRRRLEESANQLHNIANQYNSITEIAFHCGFNSAAHFSRAFHKHFGLTPRDYRRMHSQTVRTSS